MAMTLDRVSLSYRGFHLKDVSFEVQPGEVVGFLGPNGAGKSTTLRLLLGLERPKAGSALIDGKSYRSLHHPLQTVGSLVDTQWINGAQRAQDYLRWIALSNGLDRARIPRVLEVVGLTDAAKKRVSRLSMGMRQRLGIAAALLGEPRYFIFDEPLNGLDPEGIRWVRELLAGLRGEGCGVLLSSHILGEVSAVADRVVMISGGLITGSGTTESFRVNGSLEEAFFNHLSPEQE